MSRYVLTIERPSGEFVGHFWSRILTVKSGCWEWQGAKKSNGYGHVRLNGHNISVHRLAWRLINGAIPDELHVLHRCDNRLCCNPEHLFLGTNLDNVRDMEAKGRRRHVLPIPERRNRGERNNFAKMTAKKVKQIRALYAAGGITMKALGEKYHMSPTGICLIITRDNWKHVE